LSFPGVRIPEDVKSSVIFFHSETTSSPLIPSASHVTDLQPCHFLELLSRKTQRCLSRKSSRSCVAGGNGAHTRLLCAFRVSLIDSLFPILLADILNSSPEDVRQRFSYFTLLPQTYSIPIALRKRVDLPSGVVSDRNGSVQIGHRDSGTGESATRVQIRGLRTSADQLRTASADYCRSSIGGSGR